MFINLDKNNLIQQQTQWCFSISDERGREEKKTTWNFKMMCSLCILAHVGRVKGKGPEAEQTLITAGIAN